MKTWLIGGILFLVGVGVGAENYWGHEDGYWGKGGYQGTGMTEKDWDSAIKLLNANSNPGEECRQKEGK